MCLNMDIYLLTSAITSALNVPDFELSTSEYYLVKPINSFIGEKYPQIIASFSSNNLSTIKMPQSEYFKDVTEEVEELFGENNNYILNVQQLNKTKTYYIMPISSSHVHNKNEVSMYLVVVNSFEKA